MVLYSVSDFMKLSLLNKKRKGIVVGSIVKDCSDEYPFGKVDEIKNGKTFCYWYQTLDDLKKDRNVFKRFGYKETFKTLRHLELIG